MIDKLCCPKPNIPSTALSGFDKSPVCDVLQLLQDATKETIINQHSKQMIPSSTWGVHSSLPKDNISWSVWSWWIPNNCVKMHYVCHIKTWSATSVSVLEWINALIIVTRTVRIKTLSSKSTSIIWTFDHRSCRWRWRIKGFKLNLREKRYM